MRILSKNKISLILLFSIIAFAGGYFCLKKDPSEVQVNFAKNYNEPTIITTKRLILRQANQNDKNLVIQIFQNPEIMSTLSDVKSFSDETIDFMLSQWQDNLKNKIPFTAYIAYIKSTNEFAGYIALEHSPSTRPDRASISYALLKKFWRQGYGIEMARAVMEHLLPQSLKAGYKLPDAHKLTSITGTVASGNVASKKILESVGFKFLHEHEMNRYIYNVSY